MKNKFFLISMLLAATLAFSACAPTVEPINEAINEMAPFVDSVSEQPPSALELVSDEQVEADLAEAVVTNMFGEENHYVFDHVLLEYEITEKKTEADLSRITFQYKAKVLRMEKEGLPVIYLNIRGTGGYKNYAEGYLFNGAGGSVESSEIAQEYIDLLLSVNDWTPKPRPGKNSGIYGRDFVIHSLDKTSGVMNVTWIAEPSAYSNETEDYSGSYTYEYYDDMGNRQTSPGAHSDWGYTLRFANLRIIKWANGSWTASLSSPTGATHYGTFYGARG